MKKVTIIGNGIVSARIGLGLERATSALKAAGYEVDFAKMPEQCREYRMKLPRWRSRRLPK